MSAAVTDIIFQQLSSTEWAPFCDHSVTSADVRLSVGHELCATAFTIFCRSY